MASAVSTVLEILGLALCVAGVTLFSVPAGLIVCGLGFALIGFLLEGKN